MAKKKTVGRPTKKASNKTVNLSVTVPVAVKEWLIIEAEKMDLSVSKVASIFLKKCKEEREK